MKTKKIIYLTMVAATCMWFSACKHVDEEPALNRGYKKNIRMPDAEPMTAEDSIFVAAQQAEYEQNAK